MYVSYSDIFSFSICVMMVVVAVDGGRYEIKIKMCSLDTGQRSRSRSSEKSGLPIHVHTPHTCTPLSKQASKQTNTMHYH